MTHESFIINSMSVFCVVGFILCILGLFYLPSMVKAAQEPKQINIQISDIENIVRKVIMEQTIQTTNYQHNHNCGCHQCVRTRVVEELRPVTPELECDCGCTVVKPRVTTRIPCQNQPVNTVPPAPSTVKPEVKIQKPTDKTPIQRTICPPPSLMPRQIQ